MDILVIKEAPTKIHGKEREGYPQLFISVYPLVSLSFTE